MSPLVAVLVKLGARLVVFTGVFWLAARKNEKIVFERRWAPPLVALVFAVLNTGLYWMLSPVLAIATMGMFGFALPLVINGGLLGLTLKLLARRRWFRIDGLLATLWLAGALTLAHGALWLAIDYIPARL